VRASPKPPRGLGAPGRALWRRIVADVEEGWRLDERDLALLSAAASAADRVSELEALVERDGLMIRGSKGQDRLHPAVSEARMQRALVSAMLVKVDLKAPDPRTGALSGRQRDHLRRALREAG
jgi:P27 family predicted phage terminase small subunit